MHDWATVFGTMISAVFVEFATYRWIFWFTTVIAVPAALFCVVLIPSQEKRRVPDVDAVKARLANLRRLDLVGVSVLTGE